MSPYLPPYLLNWEVTDLILGSCVSGIAGLVQFASVCVFGEYGEEIDGLPVALRAFAAFQPFRRLPRGGVPHNVELTRDSVSGVW